ncbi:MAG: hypothetical protein JSS23_03890 [Proteobacteria bacterium]|nr:hypothetical protein [Pseudomonadota bacterium]
MALKAKKRKLAEQLGKYVSERFERARDARRELFDVLSKCVRLNDGFVEADADGVDVNLNIVQPIVLGVKGLIADVLASTDEKPFTVAATPVPDLPSDVEERLAANIERVMPELMAHLPGDDPEQIFERARNTAILLMNREASKRARAMERVVSDDIEEGGWSAAFSDFLMNYCTYPYAVIKAPSLRIKAVKRWSGRQLTVERTEVRAVENVSPFDFYWSPGAPSVAEAEYVIERRNIGADELIDLATSPTYDLDLINYIIEQYPDGHKEPYESGGEASPVQEEQVPNEVEVAPICDGTYDTIGFYGKIKGEILVEFGIDVDDPRKWYESEIWCVASIPYKIALNPDPIGARPFHVASYAALPGQMHGRCPTLILEDVQRVCTATVRALVRNMALASGVIGEVDVSRVADNDDPRILYANQLRLVQAGRGTASTTAYHFHDVNSHAPELMGVLDKFLALGYEILGISRVAFGSTQGLGTIGRTAGGLSLVMNQSSKVIKDALRELERRIVEPVVQSYVDWNLMFNPDPSIKGDVHAYARGVSGVMEREAQADGLQWALQSIVPLTQAPGPNGQPMIPQAAVLRLLYSLFQAKGIPTDGILPDFDSGDAKATDAGGGIAPNPALVQQSGTPNLPLDNRSAPAAEAVQNANSL